MKQGGTPSSHHQQTHSKHTISEHTVFSHSKSGSIPTIPEYKFFGNGPIDYRQIEILNPNDPILFQGEMLKLKPGVKFEFQGRWIQVTAKALRYYKSRWTQNNVLLKPLGAVPIHAI